EDLDPGDTVRFATMLTPQGARSLSIYEGAVKSFTGSLKLVVKLVSTEVWSTTERSARIAAQQGPSGRRIASVGSSPGSEVHVELTNTHGSVAATGSGRLVFGWRSTY